MHRNRLFLILLSMLIIACQAVSVFIPGVERSLNATPSVVPTSTSTKTPRPIAALSATATSASPIPDTPAAPAAGFTVRIHPDGGLYVGDRVSFEVIGPPGLNPNGQTVQVSLAENPAEILGSAEFGRHGIAGRSQATLMWVWDTRQKTPGSHALRFTLLPDGRQWEETLDLLPASQLPSPEPSAAWARAESECCIIHTITGTQAERDLPDIMAMADEQAADVARRMGASFAAPIAVVFLARVLGHGGFTNQEISVSYLDRNYAGGSQAIVLHHEMVHLLDSQLGGDLRPTLFVEGLAVYMSGGHFKIEELPPRAAALVEMEMYLPLIPLADNFYPSQHETGYIQAGALVQYMVERWGWEAFQRFYRDIHPDPADGGQSAAIDTALHMHFELSFKQLESDFLEYLNTLTVAPEIRQDVRLTVAFYDSLRRYQLLLDPSAHYLTAWLPDGVQMREKGIIADFLRSPSRPLNLSLESLLAAANAHLMAGEYLQTEGLLNSINAALEGLSR